MPTHHIWHHIAGFVFLIVSAHLPAFADCADATSESCHTDGFNAQRIANYYHGLHQDLREVHTLQADFVTDAYTEEQFAGCIANWRITYLTWAETCSELMVLDKATHASTLSICRSVGENRLQNSLQKCWAD